MAQNLKVEDEVYVPRSRLGLDSNAPSAFYKTVVREVKDRSVRVDLPNGQTSGFVGSSAVHRNVGVLIIRIGDFVTEYSLLDPLAKSVLHFFRLLLPDDMVQCCEIRTTQEFQYYWNHLHNLYSHVILIGHGRTDAICFGDNDWVGPEALTTLMAGATPKTFISLCCKTGYAAFAKEFSSAGVCQSLIAPYHSVHGAVASQFCQSVFGFHLLNGDTHLVAFKHARKAILGGSHFRLWEDGDLRAGEK